MPKNDLVRTLERLVRFEVSINTDASAMQGQIIIGGQTLGMGLMVPPAQRHLPRDMIIRIGQASLADAALLVIRGLGTEVDRIREALEDQGIPARTFPVPEVIDA